MNPSSTNVLSWARGVYWTIYARLWKLCGAKEGWRWFVATWIGHGLAGFLTGLIHERAGFFVASGYTFREGQQFIDGSSAPWYDHLCDAVFPWLGYALARFLKH